MPQRRSFAYLLGLIVIVIAPTAMSLLWYAVSRNPELRPLGVTKQALAAYNGGTDGIEIVAVVDWAEAGGSMARRRLADNLATSFAAKGVDVRITFREGKSGVQVTYYVGATTLGPYSAARAAEGVSAAVGALRMH